MRRVMTAAAVALAVVATLFSGCSKDDGQTLPAPEPSSTTTSTEPIDYTQVSLVGVDPGKAPPVTKPKSPGAAVIAGRIVEPSGAPVPNAIVRATYYWVADKPEVIETRSGADGGYRFEKLLGGRWRIRAWLPPTHSTIDVPTFFLGARETKRLDLEVQPVADIALTASVAPTQPLFGELVQLAVLVLNQSVDGEGHVSRAPVPAGTQVSIVSPGGWSILSSSDQVTDGSGTARWTMTCRTAEPGRVIATAFGRSFELSTTSCIDPASTTTTTVAPTGDPAAASTTTTRPKPKPKPTTTTTRPRTTSSTRSPSRAQ